MATKKTTAKKTPATTPATFKPLKDALSKSALITHLAEQSSVEAKHVNAVLAALENTPPELYADIVRNGIYLAGGGALLRGLDKRLSDKIGIQFHVAEDPLLAVARGTGIALKNYDKFSFLIR